MVRYSPPPSFGHPLWVLEHSSLGYTGMAIPSEFAGVPCFRSYSLEKAF